LQLTALIVVIIAGSVFTISTIMQHTVTTSAQDVNIVTFHGFGSAERMTADYAYHPQLNEDGRWSGPWTGVTFGDDNDSFDVKDFWFTIALPKKAPIGFVVSNNSSLEKSSGTISCEVYVNGKLVKQNSATTPARDTNCSIPPVP
jgi:hypothetical protein